MNGVNAKHTRMWQYCIAAFHLKRRNHSAMRRYHVGPVWEIKSEKPFNLPKMGKKAKVFKAVIGVEKPAGRFSLRCPSGRAIQWRTERGPTSIRKSPGVREIRHNKKTHWYIVCLGGEPGILGSPNAGCVGLGPRIQIMRNLG